MPSDSTPRRRYVCNRCGGQFTGPDTELTTAEVNRLSELHGIISAGLNSLHDTLVDLDGDAQQEAWADAAESLTAELEPFLAARPADEPTEADPRAEPHARQRAAVRYADCDNCDHPAARHDLTSDEPPAEGWPDPIEPCDVDGCDCEQYEGGSWLTV